MTCLDVPTLIFMHLFTVIATVVVIATIAATLEWSLNRKIRKEQEYVENQRKIFRGE